MLSGLSASTTYDYEVVSTNSVGNTATSSNEMFTTAASITAPTLATNAASSIASTTTTLNGAITNTGGANATQSGFAYGTSATLATVIATSTLGAESGTASFSQNLTGLTASTTYYVRSYATNSGGTGYGSIVSFTTSTNAPAISDVSSSATTTSATITWTTDQSSNSEVVYGTTTLYGSASSSAADVTSHSISLTGLTNSTTYQYAVVSTNAGDQTSTSTNETVTTASSGEADTANFTWQQLPVGAGGFITGMSIANDDTMVIRTDTYGAYLWNGAEWEQLINSTSMPASFVANAQLYNDGVFAIQVAPSNSSDMYMVYPVYGVDTSFSSVYKSTNKGTTWTQTNFTPIDNSSDLNASGPYRMWGQKMAINPTNPDNVYFGTGSSGLFVTTDGGNTWSTVSGVPTATSDGNGNYPGITGILFDPGNTSVIYAASYGNGVYQTTNGGTSWSQINNGSGPTTVTYAAISSNGTDGMYFAIDDDQNLWVYANGTWTEPLSSVTGVAVDPNNASHVIASGSGSYDNLNESDNTGSTWGGWSATPTLVSNDIPWLPLLGAAGAAPVGLQFDRVVPDKLYANSDRSVWNATLSGSITAGSAVTWTDQGVGIEQLVANEIIVPPVASSTPLVASWDTAVFNPNLTSYPSTFGPVADGNITAGWSIDYASSNPDFIAILADGFYLGGPQRSSYSTNDGQTWTAFPSLPSNAWNGSSGVGGGDIAVSTPDNIIFAPSGGNQPYYTTDGGNTWNAISLPGVSSWSGFMGAYYSNAEVITADRMLANTFYLFFNGVGVFKSTNSGATWTQVNNASGITDYGTAQLKATPGEAGDLWLSTGTCSNAGAQPCLTSLYHSTDGGTTWTAIPSIGESYTVGFGAPAPGQSYPAVYTVGWIVGTSTTSVTIGTGSQTLTVQPSLAYQAGDAIQVLETFNEGNDWMDGTITSYNSSTGALVVNITSDAGSGTSTDWTTAVYGGVLEFDNEGATWKRLGQWPFGSLDTVRTISGDPNIYGQVYVGLSGSGYAFYSGDGPRLRAIGISPSSGTEDTGSTVTFTLGFSEPVTVAGGTPTLTLNDGETATYTSGSGSGALTFTYTVSSGDTTSSLAATAINLNGATITDNGGNAATLSLSGLTQTGPRIAAVPATVDAVVESPSSGVLEPDGTATLTLDMSNSVTVASGTPTLSLNSGGAATYTSGSGTDALVFDYTVGSAQTASSLATTGVNLNGSTISNTEGNANLSLSGLTQTGPQVVGTTTLAVDAINLTPASYTNSQSVTLTTANPNEVVMLFVDAGDSPTATTTNSVSDTAGLNWHERADAYNYALYEYYAIATGTLSADVITVTLPTYGNPTLNAFSIVDANTSSPFDPNASLPATSTNATVSGSTSNANNLIFAAYNSWGTATMAPGSGWSTISDPSGQYYVSEYKIATTTQSGLTATVSAGGSTIGSGIMDAVQQAP